MHNEIIIKAENISNKSLENMTEFLGRSESIGNCSEEKI
jgi:hypothetical protein